MTDSRSRLAASASYFDTNQKCMTYGIKHVPTNYGISDITLKKDKLVKCVELINKSDLDVVHFADAVEDFLAE